MFESNLFSLAILTILAILLIVPSLHNLPGVGVFPAILIILLVVWQRGDGSVGLGLVKPDSCLTVVLLSLVVGTVLAFASAVVIEPLTERWTGVTHDLSALGPIRANLNIERGKYVLKKSMLVRYVVFHTPGPAWQDGVDFREQHEVSNHVGKYQRLFEDSKLELGGFFLHAGLGGMMVAVPDVPMEELNPFAAQDPAVQSGLLETDAHL